MGKIVPIILALAGLGAGIGAGKILRPEVAEVSSSDSCNSGDEGHDTVANIDSYSSDPEETDFVKLNNQFIVPVVSDGKVKSLVVLSLTLEVVTGQQDQVYQGEPKLRDLFLQVLFDHANAGGFDGAFTSGQNMELLRNALLESARKTFGASIANVLIVDLVRQDV